MSVVISYRRIKNLNKNICFTRHRKFRLKDDKNNNFTVVFRSLLAKNIYLNSYLKNIQLPGLIVRICILPNKVEDLIEYIKEIMCPISFITLQIELFFLKAIASNYNYIYQLIAFKCLL